LLVNVVYKTGFTMGNLVMALWFISFAGSQLYLRLLVILYFKIPCNELNALRCEFHPCWIRDSQVIVW